MIDLSNQTAIITGASRGIGLAIAKSFMDCGANVIGTATSEIGLDKIQSYIKNNNSCALLLDISKKESIESFFDQVEQRYDKVNILVNSAAITKDNLLIRMKEDDWHQIINTNLNSYYYINKKIVKKMIRQKQGKIINISSIIGHTGNVGQTCYSATKSAISGFSKSLAKELASKNITVNVIAPGYIETEMTNKMNTDQQDKIKNMIPMRKIGKAQDVANTALFLASNMSSYITGETIHINGGMFMS